MKPLVRAAIAVGWLLLAIPGVYQLLLLATAIAGRVRYPYDLEWMEGGMLHHALRIQQGQGIYVPPSIDFIPYLYTPLYPGLLALFGGAFGLTYTLGRTISVISLVGIAVIGVVSIAGPRHRHASRGPALAGAVLALGLFAATYPFVEGWFDLVRADTMFLALATGGIAACARWAVIGAGREGHARIAAAAVILVLAFFTKQTGFLYVGFGGLVVLVLNWRRAVTFTLVAGVLGLGFTALLNSITDGWFWIYVSKIHRAHDFDLKRFRDSFGLILLHFPAMTAVIGLGLVATIVAWWVGPRTGGRRTMPPQAQPLLLWTSAYAMSTVVGAIGFGTEFAHFNAFMPAFLHGALAAGAAVPAIAAAVRIVVARPGRTADLASIAAPAVVALALALTLVNARWEPSKFVPNRHDVDAGDRLIAEVSAIDGDVWMPSHPWYAKLAGKSPHVHRMGIKDVTARDPRQVGGLDDALRAHAFSAIVFDNIDLANAYEPELQQLRILVGDSYRLAQKLGPGEQPRVFTGAKVVPDSIWVPAIPAKPPAGGRVLFDFEGQSWDGWGRTGAAWGHGPMTEVGSRPVLGATGRRFGSSATAGDAAVGRVSSPTFLIDGARITMRLGGTTDHAARVELWVDDAPVKTAFVPAPGGPTLRAVSIDVGELHGKVGHFVLVDDATGPGGYLLIDDAWLLQ